MDPRKTVIKILCIGYATLFVLLLFIIYLLSFGKEQKLTAEGEVSVEGFATITVSPDVANVSFELSSKEKTASEAKDANDAKQIKMGDVLKKYNIQEKDLKMNYINIRPYYEHNNGRSEIVGYIAQKTITIKIREIEKYNAFIDDLLKIGISNVNSVEFTLEEVNSTKNQAREKALEVAREKAELYASTLGKKIVDVVQISEMDSGVKYNRVANYREARMKSSGRAMTMEDADANVEEERGSIAVNASLFVVFLMK